MSELEQAKTHLATAEHYLLIGQWKRARDAAVRCLAIAPDDSTAHAIHALALASLGEHEAAEREADLAIQCDAGDYYPYYARGRIAGQADQWREAESYLRKALEQAPDNTHLYQDIAEALFHQDRYEEAWALHQRALHAFADEADTHLIAAKINYMRGDHPLMEQHLATSLRLDPENAETQRLHAFVQIQGERLVEGTEALRDALRLDPTHTFAQQSLKFVEQVQHPFFRFFAGAEVSKQEDGGYVGMGVFLAFTALIAVGGRYSGMLNPLLYLSCTFLFHIVSFFLAYCCLCALLLYRNLGDEFPSWKRLLNGIGFLFFLLLPGAYWLVPKA